MDSLKMHSKDITKANIEKIAILFPNCITETQDEHGRTIKAIDFDLLRQELSKDIVDGPQERYQLNWPGKRQALLTANAPIAKTLRPYPEESVDFDKTQNLFIEGDNLDALKMLQETYLGKVKMIYIDPPYNTGKDFVYKDNFSELSNQYLLKSGQSDIDGNRLFSNTETNGRFHSDWLSMMYSRLKLARNLLRNDGVIFISIDDNELYNLREICNEIFGEDNFVSNIVWQKKYAATNDAKGFSNLHDHILVYRKGAEFSRYLLPRTTEQNKPYKHDDKDGRGLWRSDNLLVRSFSESGVYPIVNPNTGKEYYPPKGSCWRASQQTMKSWLDENRIYFGKDGLGAPQLKRYLSEVQQGRVPNTWWTFDEVGHNDAANKELKALFESKAPFDTPKPTTLIKQMLLISTKGDDIILDFFAGSSTTADAVMQLNAEDKGNRKFIMIQLPEPCDKKSEAYKTGYKTIAEISKDRIRRAGKKIKEQASSKEEIDNLDIGFRVLKVDSSNMANVYYTINTINQDLLTQHTDNVKPERTPNDILFQVLLDWGVDLTLPIKKQIIHDNEVFFVDEDALVACFENNGKITEEFVKELTQYSPLRVVFLDSGFASDSVKINVNQIFKQLSPHTEVKTI
ncbi:TPA: site-specific DNA-methyltransferase [Legionella pneumophila]|nr:site-specific DNA-methyltransferase [Legionella pneumophila]HAT5916680.1 site-specific DNA-methyltransferase [Legionella pneumophila]HAU1721234.1 site-specific DNA-methyltransferase [Legionella pneumophila]